MTEFNTAIESLEAEIALWNEFNADPALSEASPEIVSIVSQNRLIALLKAADSVCKSGVVALKDLEVRL